MSLKPKELIVCPTPDFGKPVARPATPELPIRPTGSKLIPWGLIGERSHWMHPLKFELIDCLGAKGPLNRSLLQMLTTVNPVDKRSLAPLLDDYLEFDLISQHAQNKLGMVGSDFFPATIFCTTCSSSPELAISLKCLSNLRSHYLNRP